MKKTIKNPAFFILLVAAIVLLGGNLCCKGKASTQDTTKTTVSNPETSPEPATGGVITLTDDSFDSKVGKGLVLVDFWATWCRPCKMQAPIMESISSKHSGKVVVGKLDVDQNPAIANRYQVQSIPTLILFKNGKPVEQFVGVTDEATLSDMIQKHSK